MTARTLFLFLALVPACRGCGEKPPVPVDLPRPFDAGPRSPPGKVHAYPPHAIRSDGVGPYLLGEPMRNVLRELPEGPSLELLQVGRYANWRVARAEAGAIVIGADARNEVTFISVLRPDVARTANGVAVGTPLADLKEALGPPIDPAPMLRDPRLLSFASLPGAVFLIDRGRVGGVVVMAPSAEPGTGPACPNAPAAEDDVVAVAKLAAPGVMFAGCVTSGSPEAVVVAGGELAIVGGEAGKLRRVAYGPIGAADLAGAFDLDGDHRDEIVIVAERREPREHAVEVRVFRWDAGRLVEALVERPFVLTDATGVATDQIHVALEVRSGKGGLIVGGYYTAMRDGVLRELAPLAPVTLKVELRRRPPDAGP